MAGYFSNHSNQSRFLANSASTQAPSTTHSPAPTTTPVGPPRQRVTSSKHFSTSLSTASEEHPISREKSKTPHAGTVPSDGTAEVHPLRNTWVFWFRQQRPPGNKITNYEEGIKKISPFSSVESFWSLWTHLHPPSTLVPTTDYLLFHSGVRRPVWEDPLNLSGGKWIIRLKKGITDRVWEDLVLGIIGDQFDECTRDRDPEEGKVGNGTHDSKSESGDNLGEWPQICGATLSVRQSEDILSIWNRVDGDMKLREKIRDTIRKVLHLPQSTIMEYKSNNDSMQDKSSFRNPAVDRMPLS